MVPDGSNLYIDFRPWLCVSKLFCGFCNILGHFVSSLSPYFFSGACFYNCSGCSKACLSACSSFKRQLEHCSVRWEWASARRNCPVSTGVRNEWPHRDSFHTVASISWSVQHFTVCHWISTQSAVVAPNALLTQSDSPNDRAEQFQQQTDTNLWNDEKRVVVFWR